MPSAPPFEIFFDVKDGYFDAFLEMPGNNFWKFFKFLAETVFSACRIFLTGKKFFFGLQQMRNLLSLTTIKKKIALKQKGNAKKTIKNVNHEHNFDWKKLV